MLKTLPIHTYTYIKYMKFLFAFMCLMIIYIKIRCKCTRLYVIINEHYRDIVDPNGLIKIRHIHRCRNDDNPSYAKSLSWKIELHVLSHARVKSAASFALSKSRCIAFSIRLMDTAEVFNLRTRHVLRFHYISLILRHTQNVSLTDTNYINNDI